jgi:hypothetical protein
MGRSKARVHLHPELWRTEEPFSGHSLYARIHKNGWWPTDDQARPVCTFRKELYERSYVLYGLSADEIKLVEESVQR